MLSVARIMTRCSEKRQLVHSLAGPSRRMPKSPSRRAIGGMRRCAFPMPSRVHPAIVQHSYAITTRSLQSRFRHSLSSSQTSTGTLEQKAKSISNAFSFPSGPIMALAVFGGAWIARWWYSFTLNGDVLLGSKTGAPRQDQSKVTIVLPQNFSYTKSAKKTAANPLLLQVDHDDLQEFLDIQRLFLQSQKKNAKEQTLQILHQHLAEAMQDCQTRGVRQFATWYFSYSTTYKLLSIAMKSAAKHAISIGQNKEQTLQQDVTRDLQRYICEKYQAMVLRPAVTDPKIHRALIATLEKLQKDVYQPALTHLEDSIQQYARGHDGDATVVSDKDGKTSSSYHIPPGSITLELDWKAQLQKAQHLPIAYEKNPPEFSVALIGGSAVAGKVMGGTAVKAVSANLATPFATKAVGTTLGGKAAAGAAGGMITGGPLGGAMGAAVGVGMDMALNKGVSLMQRSTFEKDVRESLHATLLEWQERMLPEVDRVVQEEWLGGLESMLQVKEVEQK